MPFNVRPSCLHFPSAGITGMYKHACFYVVLGVKPRALCVLGKSSTKDVAHFLKACYHCKEGLWCSYVRTLKKPQCPQLWMSKTQIQNKYMAVAQVKQCQSHLALFPGANFQPLIALVSPHGDFSTLMPYPHTHTFQWREWDSMTLVFVSLSSEALMIQSSRIYTPLFKFIGKLAVVNKAYLNSKASAYKIRFPPIWETSSRRRFSVALSTLTESLA